MRTLSLEHKLQRGVTCSCPDSKVSLQGYTSPDTEFWLPLDLSEALEGHFGFFTDGYYSFTAAPSEVYALFANFEIDMALTLMNYGIRSVKEALAILDWIGYGWVSNTKNSASSKFACETGIDVNDFLDAYFASNDQYGAQNTSFFDSLLFLCECVTFRTKTSLACLIAAGQVRLSDVQEIGFELISECVDSERLHHALKRIKYGEEGFTTEAITTLLKKGGFRRDMLRRLKIMEAFNPVVAIEAKHLGYLSNYDWTRANCSSKQFAYADELFGMVYGQNNSGKTVSELISLDLSKALCDADADMSVAAPLIINQEKPEHIVAVSAGIHTAMTDGWL